MKKSFLLLSTGLIVFAATLQSCKNNTAGSGGGEAVALKLNLAAGSKYAYEISMKTDMTMQGMGTTQEMTMGMVYDVQAGEGTDKQLSVSYDHISMNMKSPMMNMKYDSRDSANSDTTLRMMGTMLNKPFTMTLSPTGEIKKIEGLDRIVEQMAPGTSMAEMETRKQLAGSFNDTSVRAMIEQSLNIYPDKPVKAGDTWTKAMVVNMGPIGMKIDNTYKLDKIDGGFAYVTVNAKISSSAGEMVTAGQNIKIELSGTSKGTMVIDVASGFLKDSQIKQTIDGNMSAAGMQVPVKMLVDVHTTGGKK